MICQIILAWNSYKLWCQGNGSFNYDFISDDYTKSHMFMFWSVAEKTLLILEYIILWFEWSITYSQSTFSTSSEISLKSIHVGPVISGCILYNINVFTSDIVPLLSARLESPISMWRQILLIILFVSWVLILASITYLVFNLLFKIYCLAERVSNLFILPHIL